MNLKLQNILIKPGNNNILTVLGSVRGDYSFRNLGWGDTKKFNFFVKNTLGDGNCYINGFYQAINSLTNLPNDCLFLRDPNFVNKLVISVNEDTFINYIDIDYNDPKILSNIYPKVRKTDLQSLLVDTFRIHLGFWLSQPYFTGERYISEEEAHLILNSNIENIKMWFFDKFLDPNNWTYTTSREEAITFVINIINNYGNDMDKFKDYLDTLDVIDINFNLEPFIKNNIPLEQFFELAKPYNFNGVPFSEHFIKSHLNTLQTILKAYNTINESNYYQIYLNQWEKNNLKKIINRLSREELSVIADDIIQKYEKAGIELDANFKTYFINNPIVYIDAFKEYINLENENFLNFIKDQSIFTIINLYISENTPTDEIITNLCEFLNESEYKKALQLYIVNLTKLTEYVYNFYSINLYHKKYSKYSKIYFDDRIKNVDLAKQLATQSIYYETNILATVEEIEKEFNTDFRFQTNSKGYIMPKYSNRNGELFDTDYTKVDENMHYPVNLNYFLFDQGYFMRLQNPDYSFEYLYIDIATPKKWSGHNVTNVLSKILGIESHIYESYSQNFLYRYQIDKSLSDNVPIVMINYTGNHYETCGYKNEDNQYVTYFRVGEPFWTFLKEYDLFHIRENGDLMDKNEWYTLNKDKFQKNTITVPKQTALPFLPKLPGPRTQLPGIGTQLPGPQLSGTQLSQNKRPPLPLFKPKNIHPNKMTEALQLAEDFGLNLNNPKDIADLLINKPDLENPE